jgi:hypothetical protein
MTRENSVVHTVQRRTLSLVCREGFVLSPELSLLAPLSLAARVREIIICTNNFKFFYSREGNTFCSGRVQTKVYGSCKKLKQKNQMSIIYFYV